MLPLFLSIGLQQAHNSSASPLSALPNPQSLSGISTIAGQQPLSIDTPPQFISLDTALTHVAHPAQSKEAVNVGPSSPPVPKKLADKIWKGEYIDLCELLPSQLGAPEPTVYDLFGKTERVRPRKRITSIQEWMLCFNTYTTIVTIYATQNA